MNYFLAVSASPSKLSRNSFLLHHLARTLKSYGTELRTVHAIDLEPFTPETTNHLANLSVRGADAILLVSPVPSEDWTGYMKSLLRSLPTGAFRHKPLLLVGTGGFVSELQDLERALAQELSRLAGHLFLSSIHVGIKNWVFAGHQPPQLTHGTEARLTQAIDRLHALATDRLRISEAA